MSWCAVKNIYSNMGSCRFWQIISLNHGPPVHHSIKWLSTVNLYCLLVSIIHDKPTWWNTTALVNNGRNYINIVSENFQVTVLLQLFHWIQTSVTSSLSNWNWTLKNKMPWTLIEMAYNQVVMQYYWP